ncbi:OmpA family protein, partial [Escherichia coli]|nr:OmpA family protein [Escherichia coli]
KTDSMTVSGRGKVDPVASNDTPEGRASNRRVEIRLQH